MGISYHNIGMMCVSIHAPLKERDIAEIDAAELKLMFQSARPRRGATAVRVARHVRRNCFNPRAPEGARQQLAKWVWQNFSVSIRAPPKGRDPADEHIINRHVDVSIRAPPKGRDRTTPPTITGPSSFNPRAPEGARRHVHLEADGTWLVSIRAPPKGRDPQ